MMMMKIVRNLTVRSPNARSFSTEPYEPAVRFTSWLEKEPDINFSKRCSKISISEKLKVGWLVVVGARSEHSADSDLGLRPDENQTHQKFDICTTLLQF